LSHLKIQEVIAVGVEDPKDVGAEGLSVASWKHLPQKIRIVVERKKKIE
jgi:hypothetical protein